MKKYKPVDVSEKQLEDFIRQGAELIEDGMRYIDHQKMTDRGPLDVLMVDSGNSLVVAELKVVEEDSMLVQGIDYYDYVSRNIEGLARAYKDSRVDPKQKVRLFLIAPSLSVMLINRCKWIDIPISLISYTCIRFDDSPDIIPVFSEVTIPSAPEIIETYSLDDRLNYITDDNVRGTLEALIAEIKEWDQHKVTIEPIKYDISLKVSGKVFSYLIPRRKYFIVHTKDHDGNLTSYPIKSDKDLEAAKALLKTNYENLT